MALPYSLDIRQQSRYGAVQQGGRTVYLRSYRVRNYRRLRDVHVELADDISIFVGANNSGKTAATHAVQTFLSGSKEAFSLFDFSSHVWSKLRAIGHADPVNDETAVVPSMSLDLWFEVAEADLHLVYQILPSLQWRERQVGVRIEFGARDARELLQRFRAKQAEAGQRAGAIPGGAGAYSPWPSTLPDYLEKELSHEYGFRYFVLDRARFNEESIPEEGYQPAEITGEPGGARLLKSILRIDCLSAQRHLADPSSVRAGDGGRGEDLSRRLSSFYKRNLGQRDEDHSALKALFESEAGLNAHLKEVFGPTLEQLVTLGYSGPSNPRIEIRSGLNPESIMRQDARVHYIFGDGAEGFALPDSYNGLGFKNLIYMVVEILDLQAKWMAEEDDRAVLHLIYIEEPEAHMHAQLQQVFIRQVLRLLKHEGGTGGVYKSQIVVTTHSPHILYERSFVPIRYFRRVSDDGHQTTQVLNLSAFQSGPAPKDRDFLQRYLKLTHCDLFFADAVILVEGNVERLLLPLMIEKVAPSLRSAAVCILEVGGAFAHRFKELIQFLGLTTLIITDLDSVTVVTSEADSELELDMREFEAPGDDEGTATQTKRGVRCLPGAPNAVTANQTLIQWLPKKRTIADLLAVIEAGKCERLAGFESANVRVAFQVNTDVQWREERGTECGRTLEVAFGLENATWCQAEAQQALGLRLRTQPASIAELADGLHKRVIGKGFDKTRFALGVLERREDDWQVPQYIKEGLEWLEVQVAPKVAPQMTAVIEAADAEPVSADATTESAG